MASESSNHPGHSGNSRRPVASGAAAVKALREAVTAVTRQRDAFRQRLIFESFEPRVLLSADPGVPGINGVLEVLGGSDHIRSPVADEMQVADTPTDAPALHWSVSEARNAGAYSERGGFLAYAMKRSAARIDLRVGEPATALGGDAHGQPAAGLSVTLSHAEGARSVVLTIADDAGLLRASDIALGPDLPEGSTLTTEFRAAGEVLIEIVSPVPLGANTLDLLHLRTPTPARASFEPRVSLEIRDVAIDGGKQPVRIGDGQAVAPRVTLSRHHGAEQAHKGILVAVNDGGGSLFRTGDEANPRYQLLRAKVGGTLDVPVNLADLSPGQTYALVMAYPVDKLELQGVHDDVIGEGFSVVAQPSSQAGALRLDITRLGSAAVDKGTVLPVEFRVKAQAKGILNVDLQWYALDADGRLLPAQDAAGETTAGIQGGWLSAWLAGRVAGSGG